MGIGEKFGGGGEVKGRSGVITPQQSRLRAFLFKVLGITFVALGIAIFLSAKSLASGAGEIILAYVIGALFGGLGGLFSQLGRSAYIQGKKHLASSAEAKLAEDTRPPVLYLRSFLDEKLDAAGGPPPRTIMLPSFITQEEQLVRALEDIGPTVAIGEPNEPLPEVGAARMYVEPARWKHVVTDFMAKACLVVIRVGRQSEGLIWEEEQALKRMQPHQVVFVVPDDADSYRKLRSRLNPRLAAELPAFEEWHAAKPARLRAVLYFLPGWQPKMVDLGEEDDVPKCTIRMALQPIIDQLNSTISGKHEAT